MNGKMAIEKWFIDFHPIYNFELKHKYKIYLPWHLLAPLLAILVGTFCTYFCIPVTKVCYKSILMSTNKFVFTHILIRPTGRICTSWQFLLGNQFWFTITAVTTCMCLSFSPNLQFELKHKYKIYLPWHLLAPLLAILSGAIKIIRAQLFKGRFT